MENASNDRGDENIESEPEDPKPVERTQGPGTMLPLIITLIGIFCYIGVILPSVFDSQSSLFNYGAFDMTLLIGGAALVALGAYFWFTARVKTMEKPA
jgi:peptidoglycan/LPS O-acetylase OafA/YrhL